ncbi:hypothetical protein HY488_01850 [Candidatus Woesearchaeota archaeon]|nr:hypothetical protein [Candidatus Woesearchaeota archaeon]
MEYLPYLGIAVVSFLGLLAGIVLGAVSPEEVVSGRRWLLLLKKAVYILLIALLLYYHHTLLQTATVLVIGGAGYLLLNYRSIYSLLGMSLGILYFSPALLHGASIIFLFGLPMGSLMASTRKNATLWRMLKSTMKQMWLIFFLPALLIPLILLAFV